MTDEMRDEVPVPHYENALWHTLAKMHAEQGSAATPTPAPPAVAEVRLRRRARRLFVAGVGSMAAAAVVLAAIVAIDSDQSPDTEASDDTSPTGAPEMSLAAQITAATDEASTSSLIHTLRDNQYDADDGTPIGDEEVWTDEQTGAMRTLAYGSDGQPSFDTGRAVAPAVDDPGPPPIPPGANPFDPSLPQERLRQVDHCFAEYREYDQTAIPGSNEAEQIGEWLAQGSLVEDGTEVIDGRELIRLVQVPVGLEPRGDDEGAESLPAATTTVPLTDPDTDSADTDIESLADLVEQSLAGQDPDTDSLDPDTFEYVEHIYLVDAETYRPVRVIGYPGEAPDYSDAMYVATIEYLPRTPENMALLSTPVPDGFEQVAELRGDGERFDECGW
ncbi:MAG TPA: hypothetical protein VK611_26980 [Acidimicrobiales bacterium]|nr:hypothetical protein [Acidimicrobiales bacterium]